MKAIVVKSTGSWYEVRDKTGTIYQCRIPGRFKIQNIRSTNPIAVGDVVEFTLEKNKTMGVITFIHRRKNYIVRKSVNLSKKSHVIASNIDITFLVITIDNPVTTTIFIDRFLVVAQAYQIPVVLLFNKIDLLNTSTKFLQQKYVDIYTALDYECLEVSAIQGVGLSALKAKMKRKVSLFSGHSGVGKSTLVNAVEPILHLKTAAISTQHKQGQHTTTFAQMHPLSFGGYVVDTPGIKGFGMVDFKQEELADYFREFFALKSHCKFHNCKHINEPNCAVKKALKNAEISKSRYESYLQMMRLDVDKFRRKTT